MLHITDTTILSGDVTGTWKNLTVTKLKNLTLDMSAIADGRMLVYNGTTARLTFIPKGVPVTVTQIHSQAAVMSTGSGAFIQDATYRFTVTEAGNYLVKFTGCARDGAAGGNIIYALFRNGVEVAGTRRQFGAIGITSRQINQIFATHFYFTSLAVNDLITVGMMQAAGGSMNIDGRNLTVIKI
jgi:hypothetical protein